jgi:hypothetical protein
VKKRLKAEEKYGLTPEQIAEAERFIRKNKSIGAIAQQDAVPLYEMFVLGYAFQDLVRKFPQYELGRVIYTAAAGGWIKDRERLASSVYDRIRARVIRSTVEQVEFLTDMVAVSTAESSEEVRKYLANPNGQPPPQLRIKSFKDYQQVIEMLASVTESIRMMANPKSDEDKPKLTGSKRVKALKPAEDEGSVMLAELAGDAE